MKIGIVYPYYNECRFSPFRESLEMAMNQFKADYSVYAMKGEMIKDPEEKLKLICELRNEGIKKALEDKCDAIFITDDDLLLHPLTFVMCAYYLIVEDAVKVPRKYEGLPFLVTDVLTFGNSQYTNHEPYAELFSFPVCIKSGVFKSIPEPFFEPVFPDDHMFALKLYEHGIKVRVAYEVPCISV
jgi:hypothetical protein